jgi:hypothetical protein
VPIALFHVTSILITLIIFQASDPKTWLALVYSLGFAHYLLSLIYAKRQFTELAQQPNLFVPVFSVVILGAGLYLSNFSLLFYFVLHHSFNEVYVLNHTTPIDNEDVRKFRGSAVLLHALLYFFLLRNAVASDLRWWVNPQLLLAGLAVAYVAFFYYLYRLNPFLDLRTRIENCSFELLGLAAVAVSFYVQFAFLHLVFSHFVFWAVFPASKMYTQDPGKLLSYIGLTTLFLALFLLLSPVGVFSSQLSPGIFQKYFIVWSYIHITASFVLSNAHPPWIVDLFRPRPVGGGRAMVGRA